MRFHRPIGTLLVLYPVLWSLWINSEGFPQLKLLCIFILGTALMRAAGCVINDILDRKYDPSVVRTKDRPLASGELSVKQAFATFILLLILAASLLFFLPLACTYLALCIIIFVACYPLMKRFFAIPQLFLGITFNSGILMAGLAIHHTFNSATLLLYLASIFWTLAYDTQYAKTDEKDDRIIGLHSSAVFWGRYANAFIMGCQVVFLLLMLFVGIIEKLNAIYYGGLIVAIGLFIYQFRLITPHPAPMVQTSPARGEVKYFQAFLHNQWVGLCIFLGIALSFLW